MSKISRHKSREYLFQALYSRAMHGADFDIDAFLATFFDAPFQESIDTVYVKEAFAGIVAHEGSLLAIVAKYAPRFDITIMPVGNILPIMIAAYEMLYLEMDKVPEKVSINEALEITKTFSDESARPLVNGVLNALKNDRETIKIEVEKNPMKAHFFG